MARSGVAYNGRLSLFDGADIVNNPTLAAGDVVVIDADSNVANIATLPAALAGDQDIVEYALSAAEMAAGTRDTVTVKFEDQAGAEWDPVIIDIPLDTFADEVWNYATRTLTQGAASVISAVLGDNVTVYKDVYWDVTLTGLTSDLTDASEVYVAIKNDIEDDDDESILFVSETTGIEYINGDAPVAPVVAGDGVLTVLTATSVQITLASRAAALILPNTYVYGIKRIATSDGEAYLASAGGQWRVVYAEVEDIA